MNLKCQRILPYGVVIVHQIQLCIRLRYANLVFPVNSPISFAPALSLPLSSTCLFCLSACLLACRTWCVCANALFMPSVHVECDKNVRNIARKCSFGTSSISIRSFSFQKHSMWMFIINRDRERERESQNLDLMCVVCAFVENLVQNNHAY